MLLIVGHPACPPEALRNRVRNLKGVGERIPVCPSLVWILFRGHLPTRGMTCVTRAALVFDPKTLCKLGKNKDESILELCNEAMDLNVRPACIGHGSPHYLVDTSSLSLHMLPILEWIWCGSFSN